MGLSDTAIQRAKAGPTAYGIPDGGGLHIWVTPSGGKLFRYAFRFKGKRQCQSYGAYPAVSLARARELHREARALLASGVNPMAKRKADKVAERVAADHSFANVAALWLKDWRVGKSPRHADYVERRLEADILPALGTFPIEAIKASDIVRMAKTIQQRGAIDIAKRALETTGQVFRYAIAHDMATRNPVKDFKPGDVLLSVPKTNYARIDQRELPTLLRKLELYQGTQVTRLAMKLLALTFVRTTELINAPWTEFDFEAKRWNIPAERMKMRTPHIVPLSKQALEVLTLLKELTGKGALLFPGERNAKRPMSNNTILKGLERMGYKGLMTGHGFRGLASTILHEQGYDHAHIELQLAHTERNQVSASYNHALYLEPRTKMMQEWADYLEKTLRG